MTINNSTLEIQSTALKSWALGGWLTDRWIVSALEVGLLSVDWRVNWMVASVPGTPNTTKVLGNNNMEGVLWQVFGELQSQTSYLFILVMPVIYDVLYSSTVTSFARVIISAPRPK